MSFFGSVALTATVPFVALASSETLLERFTTASGSTYIRGPWLYRKNMGGTVDQYRAVYPLSGFDGTPPNTARELAAWEERVRSRRWVETS